MVAYQGEDVLGGKEVKFSQVFQQRKPVVLNFWAGQCPPCRAEMPEFQKVADEYASKVIFVGVDVGPFTNLGSHDDGKRLLAELGIRYPTAYAVDASPLQPYGVRAMPTTVYLTATGEIQDTVNGIVREPQLRSALQRLVGS
jgi:cytochrome c-type biogenesis protein